jgi:hypothetical protein
MAQDNNADEAPYGWSVIGEDGRRIDRWLSITAAQELVRRIAANTDETVTLEPSEPNAVSTAGVGASVNAQIVSQTTKELVPKIKAAVTTAELDAIEAAENETDDPRSTVLEAVEKRRAELGDQQ